MARQNRVFWLDCARAFAIISVLLCHAVEACYSLTPEAAVGISSRLTPEAVADMSFRSELAAFTGFTAGRLGVPIFLFLTGYLMLDRYYDADACKRFYISKWLRLLICIEIWTVVYDVFLSLLNRTPLDFTELALNLLFLKNVSMDHFWYMPMILGLYLFLPLVANALQQINRQTLAFPLLVSCLLFVGLPALETMLPAFGLSFEFKLATTISAGFGGGVYGCYILLGYLVKKNVFSEIKPSWLFVAFVLLFAFIVTLQIRLYAVGVPYNVWYSNGLLLLCGLALFCLFEHVGENPQKRRLNEAITSLSVYSFAIYLIHFPVLQIVCRLLSSTGIAMPVPVMFLASWIVTILVSYLLAALLSKVRFMRKYVLYMR